MNQIPFLGLPHISMPGVSRNTKACCGMNFEALLIRTSIGPRLNFLQRFYVPTFSAVRKPGVSRHHGSPIKDLAIICRTLWSYGIERFKGGKPILCEMDFFFVDENFFWSGIEPKKPIKIGKKSGKFSAFLVIGFDGRIFWRIIRNLPAVKKAIKRGWN